MSADAPPEARHGGLHHEALMYEGLEGFRAHVTAFVREGLAAGEPVLVVLDAEKRAALHDELGADARDVAFADMAVVGANPARIIPAWRAFATAHGAEAGHPLRGVGEPIGPARTEAELAECHRHEALLNLAFADTPAFSLLCPYDAERLDGAVLHEAGCTHPYVREGAQAAASTAYLGEDAIAAPFDAPLPRPPGAFHALAFDAGGLGEVRALVRAQAAGTGMAGEAVDRFVLAASEIAANSIVHGGGAGVARVWTEDGAVVCEVRDRGAVVDPLAGRVQPGLEQPGGRGLWLANQLCDLVQIRAFADGGAVRLHMRV